MALGDCTQIPYRLTPDEVNTIASQNSQNTTFQNFVVYSVPQWGVVVNGGCGQILVTKDTSGNLLMADITNYTWNGQNVGATISSASGQYGPTSTGATPASQSVAGNLPQATLDVISGGTDAIWNELGVVAAWPGQALSSIGGFLGNIWTGLTSPFLQIDPSGTLGAIVVIGGAALVIYAITER
jgi:hypothetical protein